MKLPSVLCRVFIAGTFLIIISPATHACSCVTLGPCNTGWKHGQVVFLGTVTAKDSLPRDSVNGLYNLSGRIAVHFSVSEIFAGRVTAEKDTIVFTGVGGGDCGYPFVIGQSYLVYASVNSEKLATSICSDTAPALMGRARMQQLRMASNKSGSATLFGMIGIAPRGVGYEDLIESKALASVRVRAVGSAGPTYSATTNEQGVYWFDWLPADTYRLEVDLPAGLSTWQQDMGKPLVIPIGNTEDSRGCAVDVFARPAGRISGVVVDADGKPVAGFVTIVSADPKVADADRRRGGLPGFDTPDGKFTLPQIPPGRYQLVFYPKVNGQVSFRTQIRSQPIDVEFGQQIENFQFTITN